MLNTLEKATVQDFMAAKALGINESEIERISLHQMKNEMHNKAFKMRSNKETITQEEADNLNERLQEIIYKLENYDYDSAIDYIINFDSFVIGNNYYNKFCW